MSMQKITIRTNYIGILYACCYNAQQCEFNTMIWTRVSKESDVVLSTGTTQP